MVQAGLSIFGTYADVTAGPVVLDGLLCDSTVDGMRKWVAEIAEPYIGLEVGYYLLVSLSSP